MVDFQSRDTSRGIDDASEDASDDEQQDEQGTHEAGANEERAHDHGEQHDDNDQGEGDHGEGGHDHGNQEPDHGGDHSHDDHDHGDHHAHDVETLGVAVVTVSSTRSQEDDPSGDAIESAFEDAGHGVATRELIADDYDGIQSTVQRLADREDVDVVVTSGGTGVTPDDVTIEAASALFDKELPGFGELFRTLSYEEIGTMVVATRATGGIVDGVPVFCLPGSENAVRLGTEEIILEQASHLAGLAQRE